MSATGTYKMQANERPPENEAINQERFEAIFEATMDRVWAKFAEKFPSTAERQWRDEAEEEADTLDLVRVVTACALQAYGLDVAIPDLPEGG